MSFVDRLKQIFNKGTKQTQTQQQPQAPQRYVTPQGVQTSAVSDGTGIGSQANYMLPTLQPVEAAPLYNATGGSGGGTSQEDDQTNTLKAQIQDKFKSLQAVFDGLFGNIDKSYSEKANELNTAYDKQNQQLGDQFNNTLGQVQNIYGARGLSDSSYLGDKLGQVSKDYYTGLGEIGQNRQSSAAQLGQQLASTKAGLQAQRDQYGQAMQNLNQYSAADLAALQGSLGSALGNAQVTAQNFLTTPEYVSKLAEVNPIANAGTGALASQLQTLVTSSAPIFAKKEIAKGLIKRSQLTNPNEQSYWQSYFEDLLNKNGVA